MIFSISFEELLWQPSKHYVKNFNIFKTFKDVSNTLQNFNFMWATVFEMAGGPIDPPPLGMKVCAPKSLVKKGLRFQCLYLNLCCYCGFCIARIGLSKAL